MSVTKQLAGILLCLLASLSMVACNSIRSPAADAIAVQESASVAGLSVQEDWVIMPLSNASANANAADSAGLLLETHLRSRGVSRLTTTVDSKAANARYHVAGSIQQWNHAGVSGRAPEVALSLTVVDTVRDTLVWQKTAHRKGRGNSNLHATANRVMADMLATLDLNNQPMLVRSDLEQAPANTLATSSAVSPLLIAGLSTGTAVRRSADAIPAQDVQAGNTIKPKLNQDHSLRFKQDMIGNSIAFYYAANPPAAILSQFDRLVLEPDNVSAAQLKSLTRHGAVPYAYLSVGEVGADRRYAKDIQSDWVLARNGVWNSQVMDMRSAGWQQFLLKRIGKLYQAGYRGLFLDTMDSYHIAARSSSATTLQAQQQALADFVGHVAEIYPQMRLIANRGFEILDDIAPYLESIAAESLYASWDHAQQQYTAVPEADRNWLLAQLNRAREQLALDVISIDYLPPSRRDEARTVAQQIAAHGFTPWVATPAFDYAGIGSLEVKPREVLMVFDSRHNGVQSESAVHNLLASPLEYHGYVPVYLDIANKALPQGQLQGRYAGIVSWSEKPHADPSLKTWIKQQFRNRVPVAQFGAPLVQMDAELAKSLGIRWASSVDVGSAEISQRDAMIGFEHEPPSRIEAFSWLASSVSPDNKVHLSFTDKRSQQVDAVVTGPWGGYASSPAVVDISLDGVVYWIVDPFSFLQQALQLESMPMPDITTQTGQRLWLAHIDGDAMPSFAEIPGQQLGAELIHDRILTRYQLPHSISVVEGEMRGLSAYQDRRKRMFSAARKIFRLPNVELASHSYSHPFRWRKIKSQKKSGEYNLPIKDYQFSVDREVAGSVEFIDQQLAPPGKKTKMFFWTGDAYPDEKFMAAVEQLGLGNMNGGTTMITAAQPAMSLVSPMARMVGDYVQVYAPIMNENVFTNEWQGPYDGFRRVVETMQMTDKPRRLKPINIYYHYYAGTKQASLKSLEEVYNWTVSQDINPVFTSVYASKVHDFRRAVVSRYLDGHWKFSDLGGIQSLRILDQSIWPELAGNNQIAGAKALHDGMYIHTDGSNSLLFKTTAVAPTDLHLISSNGTVLNWDASGEQLQFRIAAQVPVVLELGGNISSLCSVVTDKGRVYGKPAGNKHIRFTFNSKDTGNASVNCQA